MDDILWIGSQRSEFRSMMASIEDTAKLRRVASLNEARESSPPNLAILAQARPGEFAESHVAKLRAKWKGTRFVYVLGAWCCGQKRVGDAFSVVQTVYAHECDVEKILEIVCGRRQDLVANAETKASELVAVYSTVVSYREALADSLARWGMKTVEAEVGRAIRIIGVDTVVWHVPADFELRELELQAVLKRHPGAHMLALLTYPRDFELARFRSWGVRVIAEPFAVSDLVQAMQPSAIKPVSSAA